jgi:S1-C subfamily serine protease
VDQGVLVTQVVEGTPAAEAGFRGGDIIVRVGGDPVASLDDLRFFVEYLEGPLRVQVIRKGEPVEVVVRR